MCCFLAGTNTLSTSPATTHPKTAMAPGRYSVRAILAVLATVGILSCGDGAPAVTIPADPSVPTTLSITPESVVFTAIGGHCAVHCAGSRPERQCDDRSHRELVELGSVGGIGNRIRARPSGRQRYGHDSLRPPVPLPTVSTWQCARRLLKSWSPLPRANSKSATPFV